MSHSYYVSGSEHFAWRYIGGKVSHTLAALGLVTQEVTKCSVHYVSLHEIFTASFGRPT